MWGKRKNGWATIGSSFPASGQKSWLVYETNNSSSRTTEGGIALSYKKVGGSYHQSGTKTFSGSFGFTWDRSAAQRRYQIGVVYRHAFVDLGINPSNIRYINEWVPMEFNGGTYETHHVARPTWNYNTHHCTVESKGTWHRGKRRGHDWDKVFGIHAIIADVSLHSHHEYNRYLDLAYHSKLGQKLCGNNDVPSKAGAVMQMPK